MLHCEARIAFHCEVRVYCGAYIVRDNYCCLIRLSRLSVNLASEWEP